MGLDDLIKKVIMATPTMRRDVEDLLSNKAALLRGNSAVEDSRLVSITGAARLLMVGRNTVYSLIKTGRLNTVDLNGSKRVTMRSIHQFVNGERPANDKTVAFIQASRARYAATKVKAK